MKSVFWTIVEITALGTAWSQSSQNQYYAGNENPLVKMVLNAFLRRSTIPIGFSTQPYHLNFASNWWTITPRGSFWWLLIKLIKPRQHSSQISFKPSLTLQEPLGTPLKLFPIQRKKQTAT